MNECLRDRPREVVDELKRLVVVDEGRVALFAQARQPRDVDVRHAPIQRVVGRQVDAELLDDVLVVGARRDVTVLQITESEPHVVELVRPDRARVAEHQLLHVGVGVAPHVRDRERIVAELVRDAVAEDPVRLALGEIEAVGVLVGVDVPRFVVHEVGTGQLLLRQRKVRQQLLRDRIDAVRRDDVAGELRRRLEHVAGGVEHARRRIVDRNQVAAGVAQAREVAVAPGGERQRRRRVSDLFSRSPSQLNMKNSLFRPSTIFGRITGPLSVARTGCA